MSEIVQKMVYENCADCKKPTTKGYYRCFPCTEQRKILYVKCKHCEQKYVKKPYSYCYDCNMAYKAKKAE